MEGLTRDPSYFINFLLEQHPWKERLSKEFATEFASEKDSILAPFYDRLGALDPSMADEAYRMQCIDINVEREQAQSV
ncbi:MAG: hypothetical protein V4492_01100 [Chlamydiota bacterium]